MQFKWQALLSDSGALKSEINLAFLIAAIRVTLELLTISAAIRTDVLLLRVARRQPAVEEEKKKSQNVKRLTMRLNVWP